MNWTIILDAATGRAEAINQAVWLSRDERAALATLLLLEEAPHPAAALVAVATVRGNLAAPIQAALAPHVAPALAAWRADPQWPSDAVGAETRRELTWGAAGMVGALRDRPADLCAAVDIVLHMGSDDAVARCLKALGANGWEALGEDRRGALLTRAAADDLGWVWGALTAAQRAAAVQAASDHPSVAAVLIGRIGADAWRATDPALRVRLIDAAAHAPFGAPDTAPAWAGMTDDERAALARAVIERGDSRTSFLLLDAFGAAGRATLTAAQRAALERRAARRTDAWRVRLMRAADAGWTALTDDERAALLAAADQASWIVPPLLRAVGVAGWRAMTADERTRLAVAVRHAPADLFACPPALWGHLAGDALPPTTAMKDAAHHWRAEDADADLDDLPPAHQALVLALAPWRPADATKDSARLQRLVAAWDALPDDARVALATAQPHVLATVAAAARRHGGASAVVAAVGATVGRFATATGGREAARIVGAMLRTPADWRAWMASFAPTAADPPDVGKAWRAAARRGIIDDLALCARLAAHPAAPRRTRRRAGR